MAVRRMPSMPPVQLSATAIFRPDKRSASSTEAARSWASCPYTWSPATATSAAPTRSSRAAASAAVSPRAVSRRSTPSQPGRYARPSPSKSRPVRPRMRSESMLSDMPVVRMVRDVTTVASPVMRARMRGISESASMPRISRGTPGSMAAQRPRSSSSQMPGAEPWRFSRMVAPSGMSACCLLLSGSSPGQPRAFHRRRRLSTISSSRIMKRPKMEAMDGLVRSSLVGPSPPVVITAPVRSSASRTALAISPASSPTDVRRATVMPCCASSRARCAPLVSMVKPSRSSSPIVTTSICMGALGRQTADGVSAALSHIVARRSRNSTPSARRPRPSRRFPRCRRRARTGPTSAR